MTGAGIAALGALAVAAAAFVVLALRWRGPEDTFLHALLRALGILYAKSVHRLAVVAASSPGDGPAPGGGRPDPLPLSGPCILVSNHRSGLDPIVLSVATRRRIRFLMAREYYELPVLRWLFRFLGCIPVARDGRDLRAVQEALRALRRGEVVGIFPQGGIRAQGRPERGSPGVALLSLRAPAPVVPFWVEGNRGTGSVFRSLFVPSKTVVRAGAPVEYRTEAGKKPSRADLERVTADILRRISELGEFDGESREP